MHSARAGHSHDPSLGKPPRPPGTCARTRCECVRAKGGHVDEDATPRTWVDRAVLGRARMRRPTRVASPPRHTCLAPADARRRSRACQCVLTWRIHSSQHQPIAPRDAMIPAGLEPAIPGSVGRCTHPLGHETKSSVSRASPVNRHTRDTHVDRPGAGQAHSVCDHLCTRSPRLRTALRTYAQPPYVAKVSLRSVLESNFPGDPT